MRNMYPGKCFICGKPVDAGTGFFQSKGSLPKNIRDKILGRWLLRCSHCKNKGNNGVLLQSLKIN